MLILRAVQSDEIAILGHENAARPLWPCAESQGAGDRHASGNNLGSRTAVVEQENICPQFLHERDRLGFALIEFSPELCRSGRVCDGTNSEPTGVAGSVNRRDFRHIRHRSQQLISHRDRNENLIGQTGAEEGGDRSRTGA